MVKAHLFSYHRPTGDTDSSLIDDYLQAAVQHDSALRIPPQVGR